MICGGDDFLSLAGEQLASLLLLDNSSDVVLHLVEEALLLPVP